MMKKSKRWLSFVLVLCLMLSLSVPSAAAQEKAPSTDVSITDMRTNSRVDPIGIDDATPVFSWKMQSNAVGAAQSAYQIVVTDTKNEIVWDSGKVYSGVSTDIHYQGEALSAKTAYQWSLTVWDQYGNAHPAGTASFETGLMNPSKDAWNGAEWIGTKDFFLDAETMKNFQISFDMQLQPGSTKAGIIYGANDPRMQNYTKNKWLIEGETYIYVELDVSGALDDDPDTAANINIYRHGFCADDYQQKDNTTVFTLELKNNISVSTENGDFVLDNDAGITKDNAYDKHSFVLKTSGSGGLSITLDGKTLNYVNHVLAKDKSWSYKKQNLVIINPNHATGDVNCYPLLNEIGFCAPANNQAVFDGYTIKNTSLGYDVFGEKTGATYSIWDGQDGVAIQDGRIALDGGNDGALFYADPTYGSIPYLRNEFKVEKEVKSARLYATAWGNYELYLNGERFGDDYLSPGYTQLNVTLNYMTYDVTGALKNGTNAIGFILSNGWLYDHGWNRTPALMAMMEITYADGSVQYVTTDETWQISTDTPVRAATYWQGEKYDATKDASFAGWNAAGYHADGWNTAVIIVPTSTPDLVGKIDEPVRVIEERSAALMKEQKGTDANTYIYDLGVNMVGTVTIKLPQMEAGKKLMFRYAEVCYPQLAEDNQYYYGDLTGRIAVENLRAAYCTDYYTCSGAEGGEEITFSLTYHGFRYLEITGLDTPLAEENITGLVLSSIDDQTNTYESSNELANQYFKNIMRSLWGNFVSIPTDCNQRDERQGWTGDAQVFSKTATYFGDVSSFYESWMSSARDRQALNGGSIGNTFPSNSSGSVQPYDENKVNTNGLCWSAAAIIAPWNTYLQYGNQTILEDNYELMKSFTNGLCRDGNLMPGSQYLINGGGLAEHLAFETTNPNFVQNAMFYRLLVIMEKVATIVGDDESAAKYAERAKHVKEDWNKVFVDPETGKTRACAVYDYRLQDTQASYTIPISYGVVSEENLKKMLPNMIAVMERGNVG
ncbi:MAG: family 78 glycoside hydrolase catalytic domain, partial [Clostridiales bacterium]|nr:family 78 glycoside hydrolase catalytic domain [Clostridiales bacterium]